jgi:hypothetical protein
MHAFRVTLLACVLVCLSLPAGAQQPESVTVTDTLSSSTDSFIVNVRGFASLRIQPKDSYSGTWEVQCSVDGTTYDADAEVNLFLEGASAAAVQSVTDTVGIWTASVAGCQTVKIAATAGFAATDTAIAVGAVVSGGSSGSGGTSVTADTELPAAAALADNTANPTITGIATYPHLWDGVTWDRWSGAVAFNGSGEVATEYVTVRLTSGTAYETLASDKVFGTDTYTEATTTGPVVGGIRNDTLDSLANTTNEATPFGFTAEGAAWTASSATTNGGCTPGSSISAGAVLETEIKATAGQLYELSVFNIDATPVYLRLYNLTAANADENDTPIQRYGIPGTTALGGAIPTRIPVGMVFSTAITFRVTTGIADTDTGALSANEVLVSYCYK